MKRASRPSEEFAESATKVCWIPLSQGPKIFTPTPDATFAELAGAYAYGIARNHPFVDGNKRAAFLSLGLFLGVNGYKLTASPVAAIEAIVGVADGTLSEKGLSRWIAENGQQK